MSTIGNTPGNCGTDGATDKRRGFRAPDFPRLLHPFIWGKILDSGALIRQSNVTDGARAQLNLWQPQTGTSLNVDGQD